MEPDCAPGSVNCGVAVTSLNGQSGASQTLITGTSGTDFSIVSGSNVHTLNFPDASTLNRGLLTALDWTTFNAKQAALGYTPLNPGSNLSDLTSASTARTNLGLGSLATQSGTFSGTSSGTNTGDQTTITGNAGTATALQTGRTINGVTFDGTANITVADATKVATNSAITGATKTKITYDSKGLVTAGADATTADIAASTNKNYVTDAGLTVLGNTSGTNTGDQDLSTLLVKANNLSDLASASTARTNLGLGSLATQSGTFSGTSSGTNTGDQTTITGNAGTATALQTGRTINGVTFDGTANITVTAAAGTLSGATLASGVTASFLTSLGVVTSGTWNGTTIAVANGGTGTTSGSITGTGALSFTANTTNALTLDSSTTGAINIGTNANAKTITIGNGTGATSLVLNAGTGNIDIGTNAIARTINVGTGAAVVETINLGGTGANVIGIGNTQTGGSVNIGAAMTTGTINIGGTSAQTGAITIDGGTGAQTISIGNGAANKTVTLGSTNTTSTLNLNAGSGGIIVTGLAAQTNGKKTVCIDSATKQLFLGAAASTCNTSSARYKHDIVDIGLGLEAVNALRPVSYAYNSNNEATLGFIAEEAAQVDGRLINRNADGVIDSINPDAFVPILTKAIQEQQFLLGDFSKADGLTTLIATIQSETAHDPVVIIGKKITNGQRFLTNFVSARVTAMRGYFDEVFANKTHQKTLCVGSTGNETCITKNQLDNILAGQNTIPAQSPSPSPSNSPTLLPTETPIKVSPTPTPLSTETPIETTPTPIPTSSPVEQLASPTPIINN